MSHIQVHACAAYHEYLDRWPEMDARQALDWIMVESAEKPEPAPATPEPEPNQPEPSPFAQAVAAYLEVYGPRQDIKNLSQAALWLQGLMGDLATDILEKHSAEMIRDSFVRLGAELQAVTEWAAEAELIAPLTDIKLPHA